ncbi:MAG: HAD-IC family P-type ATPase [Clostridiales bacterium]|nr:HAD-IC family P-type ATPase [Clostridiales bacterium]
MKSNEKTTNKKTDKPVETPEEPKTVPGDTVVLPDTTSPKRTTKTKPAAPKAPARNREADAAPHSTSIESVIDSSVFDDDDSQSDELVYGYYHKSMTIDEHMLSREQARTGGKSKKRKTKTNSMSLELSAAERYDTDPAVGLSKEVVAKRIEQGLDNFVKKKGGKSYLYIFVSNIFTFFNIMCFVVAAALIVVRATFSQLFFMVIISANIVIGIIQEIRSKIMIDKLSLVSAPSAIVIRDGERVTIHTSDVVLDDIIIYEMGKQICADSIVVEGECEVNESMLTGESEPIRKRRGDTLYSGSFVVSGSVTARVDKVGSANYVETLSSYAKKYRKPKSELMNSIKLIIKILAPFIIAIGAVSIWKNYNSIVPNGSVATFENWQYIIGKVAGSVVGMIPAGMFLLTSVALAASVIRLAKKQTLVQDLYCIEMLARVDVLCLDKTGTITDGSMEVKNVIEIKGFETPSSLPDIIGSMLTATGDNNQTALALANKFGYSKALKPLAVLPFSSQRKLSAVTFENEGTYMLGAPEFVLRDVGVRIEKLINENAAQGYRVLVLAHSPAELVDEKLPAVRRPLCLLVIEDHIRDDAIKTIQWFKDNNVAVKVISGDNPITVSEVAKRVGVENAEKYISLEGLSNQDVIEAADKYTVFGRVTPDQKRLLVGAIKAKKHTVAMTGDGVNDILAMREADCSVSIASGAEAAKNVSHLVLLDNDFTSMPDVVMEGRRVVNNIQASSTLFLMKTLMSIILSIIFLAWPDATYPLGTNNLLALECCSIAAPSFFLALQGNKNIIKGKFLLNVIIRAIPGGLALVMGIMSVYLFGMFSPTEIDPTALEAMYVYSISCIGIMVLIKQCEPFNVYRVVLVIGAMILTGVFLYLVPDLGIAPIGLTEALFVSTAVLSSYFIVTLLTRILSTIRME